MKSMIPEPDPAFKSTPPGPDGRRVPPPEPQPRNTPPVKTPLQSNAHGSLAQINGEDFSHHLNDVKGPPKLSY